MTQSLTHPHPAAVTDRSLHQEHSQVIQALQNVLASTYGLYLATHNYHWNIEGPRFAELHTLFESQYTSVFTAIDGLAERIRALGAYALPFEGDAILQVSKMTSNPLNKETDADARATRMVHNLVALNMAVVKSCEGAKDAARLAQDDETENLLVERVTAHHKALWMLNSLLK